jgi:hypothetical protein
MEPITVRFSATLSLFCVEYFDGQRAGDCHLGDMIAA